jgi:DNA (cytosine-5)-methyltransferase 1
VQGFPEWFKISENETTAKHQLGNAVSIPVVYPFSQALLKKLFCNCELKI